MPSNCLDTDVTCMVATLCSQQLVTWFVGRSIEKEVREREMERERGAGRLRGENVTVLVEMFPDMGLLCGVFLVVLVIVSFLWPRRSNSTALQRFLSES